MRLLPAHPGHDLDWDIDAKNETVYHLDFGWEKLDPFNEALLNANLLAVEEFVKKCPAACQVVLAHVNGDFGSFLASSELLEARFQESSLHFEVFCAQLASDYLHRLASALPDEMEPVILVDLKAELSFSKAVLLLCKRRFEHFQLKFLNKFLPLEGDAAIMVSLPLDRRYCIETMEHIFSSLEGKKFKCIPEELLNEHWEGVDTLIVDPASLSEVGKRMLVGFEAAGGEIRSRGI